MKEELEAFLLQVPNVSEQPPSILIDYFVYFITVIMKEEAATPAGIERCFEITRLQKYSNISAYLSRHTKKVRGKVSKYIKVKNGYHLERNSELEIQKTLHSGPARQETSHLLRALLSKVQDTHKQSFLQEAIDCYEIGARRAAIVLTWALAVHHLYDYIFYNHLAAFNTALAKNTDKRIKITAVNIMDDFSEIPEGKFIELARSSRIISGDIKKILDTKLGIRNSSAHPSGISISEVKATDFIIDLVDNILIKYTT